LIALVTAGGAAAADLATLQGHARGRLALVEGDLAATQGAWDGVLANRRGSLHAITLERTCDRAELAAALGRRRSLSPVWVAGTDCATLLWGAFETAEEAETQLAALPAGVLPQGARVVALLPPLAGLVIDAPPPAPVVQMVRAEPEPVKPTVKAPREPEVIETRPPEPERVEVPEPAPEPEVIEQPARPAVAAPEPLRATPTPQRVEPEPVRVPEPEPVRVRTLPTPSRTEPTRPAPRAEQPRTPETPPPLPVEPEGLSDAEREERRARAAAFFAEGNALWAGGDYSAAIAAFETALELDPNNPRILNNLGTARAFLNLSTALYASKHLEEALLSLQRVIDLEPSNLDARYNKAAVLVELRQWVGARAALLEGLDIAPGDSRLLEFLEQVDRQIAVIGSEAPASPAEPNACDGLVSDVLRARRAGELFGEGERATRERDWPVAERAYLGVLDCDPTSAAAANRLGVARLQRGDARGAREAFGLASRLDPDFLEARANACLATFASQDCEEATDCLRDLTADAPRFGPGWRELALMLYRCGRSIQAESAAVRGLELSPDDARLRGLLARIDGERVAAPR